jgi:hypothetical protein
MADKGEAHMSGGMGYYDGGLYEEGDGSYEDGQAPQQARKNPLRDHLNKVEAQNAELHKQVQELVAQQRRNAVADELQAKGYDRGVAQLYSGDPAKLDEWLTNVGPYLAKQSADTSAQGAGQQQGQAPASTVPAEGQAALQQMQQAGQFAAAPQGSEAEQIAQMRNSQDPAALMQYLQSQGNPYHWQG